MERRGDETGGVGLSGYLLGGVESDEQSGMESDDKSGIEGVRYS